MPAQAALEPALVQIAAGRPAWSAAVDVREFPDEYLVLVDLPGADPDSIDVHTDGEVLTVAATRRDPAGDGALIVRLERPAGRVRRSLRLPGRCDPARISRSLRNGVLEIRAPKAAS